MSKAVLLCEKCGAKILDGAIFCAVCGTKVPPIKPAEPAPPVVSASNKCKGCGFELSASAKFCPECGKAVSASFPHSVPPSQPVQPAPPAAAAESIKKQQAFNELHAVVKESIGIICKNCGTVLAEGVLFCGNCGNKVIKQVPCPGCGALIDEGKPMCEKCSAQQKVLTACPDCGADITEQMKFCGSCGASLKEPKKVSVPPPPPPQVQPVQPVPSKQEPVLQQAEPSEPEVAPTILTSEIQDAPKGWKLIIKSLDDHREIELDSLSYTIGRSSKCQLVIKDERVSNQHMRLFLHEGQWFIRDLGSTNGTFLNGKKMTDITEFKLGDKVRIGRTEMELFHKDSASHPSGKNHVQIPPNPISGPSTPSMKSVTVPAAPSIYPATAPKSSHRSLLLIAIPIILILAGLAGLYGYQKYKMNNPEPYLNVDKKMLPAIEESISLFNKKLWVADYSYPGNNSVIKIVYEDTEGEYIETQVEWDSATESIIVPDVTVIPLGKDKDTLSQIIDEQMASKSMLARLRLYMRSRNANS